MNFLQFLAMIIIAAICGSIGMALTGFNRGGCIVSVAVGFIGALLGTWISRRLGLPEIFNITLGNAEFPVIWSIIGAVVFSLPLSLLVGKRK